MFNGIWLVAAEPLTIKGRAIGVGERFEVSRTKSGALLVMGRAMIANPQRLPAETPQESEPPKRRRGRPRKTETAAPDPEPIAYGEQRRYRRRDLEAEE